MEWIKLPEIEPGTPREHFMAYCWGHQRDKFIPGIPLIHQLYLNPFIHTEPLCEECARSYDPNFGKGTKLELIDHKVHITKGDEPECPHKGKKSYYSILPSYKVYLACSWDCAHQMEKEEETNWSTFCEKVGLG